MKISLIMPQGGLHTAGSIFKRSLRYAPLTLTTLASLVPEELNADIEILDEGVQYFDVNTLETDLAAITCITGTSHRAYEIADILRGRGITVILGGVHPTLMPDEAQLHADAVVTGYAEETWPCLLRDFVGGQLKPRYIQGPNLSLINMPRPRRDLLLKKRYVTLNTVQATRGCPWNCSFCVVPVAWPGYYQRPIADVVAEVADLSGGSFLFLDLSPIEDPVYIKKLYQALIPLHKKWGGLATMAIAHDDEMLRLAAQSGCRGLLLGIESVVPDTIRLMGKKPLNSPANYIEDIKKIHDHGIMINGCFVLGLDGDDESVFERTLEFVLKAGIDLPRFTVCTPFPNTALYHQFSKQGRLLHHEWRYYDTQHVVFQPANMSVDRLQEGLLWTWDQTYRLSSIFQRIIHSRPARFRSLHRVLPVNLAYRFFASHLPDFALVSCETATADKKE